MCKTIIKLLFSIFTLSVASAQTPPEGVGVNLYPPTTAPNRIEVRFAIGKKPVKCKFFHLTATTNGKIIFSGDFKGGFQIPDEITTMSEDDTFNLDIKCDNYHWHFNNVVQRAFIEEGYWWVGKSYPPFIEVFQSPEFQNSAWINYLIIRPSNVVGLIYFKLCPNELKDQKPGPCYED